MDTKTCSCCKDVFPLSFFQKRAASKDGLTASCKQCLKVRDSSKHKKFREKRLAQMKEYMKTERGKNSHSIACKKWIDAYPNKRRAHCIVNNAIRDKKLFKEPCEICGSTESVHAHHDDYSKPLNVRWLCSSHHKQWHSKYGEALNP